MPHAPRHSNTPDQEAARVFESKLKRHVQENPECQWEYDWFRNTLKKSIRRSRVQIDEQVGKKAESGQALCDKFMLELAQPVSYLDAGSPRSSLFVSHSPTLTSDSSPERDPPQSIGDVSPERNTPFGLAGSTSNPSVNSQPSVPGDFIPTATSNPGNPRFNPHIAIPGTPYDESALSSVAPTPKVPGAFLASAHSLLPDSSVEHSPATRPGIIPQSDVPEIVFVHGGPDMDTPTPRFEYPSPFDNGEMRVIPRVQPTTPHTSSEAGDHPMVLDSDARVGDLRRDSSIGQEAGDNPSAQAVVVQEEGNHPGVHDRAPGGGPVAGDDPVSPAPARESVPSAPGPYRLPGSYQDTLTPGITPGASVDDLHAQVPVPPGDQTFTPIVENHLTEPALKGSDTPISDAGLELDLFPRPPTLRVPAVRPAAQSAETTPKSPISPVVPGAYRHNQSLFDLASVLSGEQAGREPVPALPSAPVSGTEPVQHVDVDQVSYSNVPPALGAIPAESTPPPTKDSPSPGPEPALHQVPRTIPSSTLQVFTEPDSSSVTPTSKSAAPSPFALIPGLGSFDIRNRIVGAPVVEEPQSRDGSEPFGPEATPESNEPMRDLEVDGADGIKLDDKALENVSPPVVPEPVVVPGDTYQESAQTSAEASQVDARSGIVISPKVDDVHAPEDDAKALPAASESFVQDVTAPATLQPEDEAQAPAQPELEDLPGREPVLDAPAKSEDIPPQALPKDEHVIPSSDLAPAPESQQRLDNQPTEPVPETPQPEPELHDPLEPALAERESKAAETDVQGPALDEVSPGDAIVSPGFETPPAVRETVHQPEPLKEPEQALLETKPEPIIEPEQSTQAPSSDHPQTESQNIPVQQPEPLKAQLAVEALPSSERAHAQSQTVESKLQATADNSEHIQPAVSRLDPSLKVSRFEPELPGPGEASQETARGLEPAKEHEPIKSLFHVQPRQAAPVSVPGDSLPPPPAADSVDLAPSLGLQPTDESLPVQAVPDAEAPPSAAQALAEPTQEPPRLTSEAHADSSSTVVGEMQQVVTDRDESLTADLSPMGRPDTQPTVELSGPGPVTIEIPGERAPLATDPEVATPVSASTAEVESIRTPQDALVPLPRAQSESPTPPDDSEPPLDPTAVKVTQLSQEAGKLAQQFSIYGNIDDLDEAIETYGQAAELLAPNSEVLDVSSYLDLGRMMRVKFETFNSIEDLDSAFDDAFLKAHDLLQSTPANKLYHDVLYELGAASLDRYLYNGSEAASDDAQRYCGLALNAEPSPSGPKRAETHVVLSRLHLARFENLSGAEDAISALESLDAASKADATLTSQARYMENRARALFACYQTRRPEYTGYLDEALVLARPARDLTPTVTIQHPIVSTFLAELLLAQYERSHNQPDLDEALELLEDAVQEVPYVCPEQPWVGERLARALLARFANGRDPEDLDDAISFLEIALNLTANNPYRRQARLDAFGGALTLRFRYLALGAELAEDNRLELITGVGSM